MVRRIFIFLVLVLLQTTVLQAQRLCEALVDNALDEAGSNCVEQDGELGCYAYDSISSTFFDDGQAGSFVSPGSTAELSTLHTLRSAELDLEEDEWGIAYLQSSVSLEAATADSSVRLFMLGDVFMENGVEGGAGATVASVFITISETTPLRDSPADTGATVAEGTSAMVLEANATSADGVWVRANFEGQVVWVTRASLFPNDAIDNLASADSAPAGASTDAAFGSLYFTTGDESDCQEAPNMLVVQGPNGQAVDISINDVPIRIGSTIGLGLGSDGTNDLMWVTVISGKATLYPDMPNAVEIPEEHFTEAFISAEVGAGTTAILDKVTGQPIVSPEGLPYVRRVPTTLFTVPAPLSEEATSYMNPAFYNTVRRLPESLLNYPLDGATDGGTATLTETICVLNPVAGIGAVDAHIGPGRGRSIRTIYEETAIITDATEITAEDGSIWYEIPTESFGLVYVSGEDVTQNCETTTREVRTECLLEPKSDVTELWGHVGPGYNRNVTNFLDITQSYVPTGRVDIEGVPWFEVPFSDTVNVWVDGEQFINLEGCTLEDLEATPPPIINPVAANTATPLPQATAGAVATQASGSAPVPTQPAAAPAVTEEPFFVTEEATPGPAPEEWTVGLSGCNSGNGDGTQSMALVGSPPAGTSYVILSSLTFVPYSGGTIFADLFPEDQPITYVDAYDASDNYLGSASGFSYSC